MNKKSRKLLKKLARAIDLAGGFLPIQSYPMCDPVDRLRFALRELKNQIKQIDSLAREVSEKRVPR